MTHLNDTPSWNATGEERVSTRAPRAVADGSTHFGNTPLDLMTRLRVASGNDTLDEQGARRVIAQLGLQQREALLAELEERDRDDTARVLNVAREHVPNIIYSGVRRAAALLRGDTVSVRAQPHLGILGKMRRALSEPDLDEVSAVEFARELGGAGGAVLVARLEGFSIVEVAARDGTTATSVNKLEQRALAELAERLGERSVTSSSCERMVSLEAWWPNRTTSLGMARRLAQDYRISGLQHVVGVNGGIHMTIVPEDARVLATFEATPPVPSAYVTLEVWADARGVSYKMATDLAAEGRLRSIVRARARLAVHRDEPLPDAVARTLSAADLARVARQLGRDAITAEEIRVLVHAHQDRLRERDVQILQWRFDERGPATLEEIGQVLGLTRERVRQLEAKALQRLASLPAPVTSDGRPLTPSTRDLVDKPMPPPPLADLPYGEPDDELDGEANGEPDDASAHGEDVPRGREYLDHDALARLLRTSRETAGIALEDVADWTGVNVFDLTAWEVGAASPDVASIVLLAELYGVSTLALLARVIRPAEAGR
ncbi:sigma factor-like helix-turn-helix DNA-binding protein [Deinococcus yavapaiensis]|uniref:Sigma-70-like protein n=1 Tax=Deinococcus yavapaiensis KR-236 TaxID=694435 RepID=A0A318S4R9_9DEIO|nr:sigma factor-like helix-turn-helix DNA-binding protein [Deinococcus yavapaiensis]PYE51980.1 sigma-70-like protein [Deinococcus yavapaiensis KR-236]